MTKLAASIGLVVTLLFLAACSDGNKGGKGQDMTSVPDMVSGSLTVDLAMGRDLSGADLALSDDLALADDLTASVDDLARADDLGAQDDLVVLADLLSPDLAPLVTGCQPPPPYVPLDPVVADIPSTTLALWIRADVGLSLDDQSRVCSADDQSGNGHHFTQVTPTSRPTVGTLSSLPAIAYTGLQELSHADVLGIDPLSPRTIYVVFEMDATSARTTPFMQGDLTTNDIYLGVDANTFMTSTNKYGVYMTGNAYDGDVATDGDPRIQSQRIDSMEVGEPILDHMTSRLNGKQLALTETPGGTGDQTFFDFSGASSSSIGYPRSGQDYQVAEVLVWSSALTTEEIGKVEAYLSARYGITLVN